MIGFLRGLVKYKSDNHIILDVNGVGYEVLLTGSNIFNLHMESKVNLFIYTHVKEDSLELFGFLSFEEKQLFKILISISGIGPKLGLTILNTMDVYDLVNTIKMGNSRILTKIPGIGNKTAERIVLELKNKPAIKSFLITKSNINLENSIESKKQPLSISNEGQLKPQFNYFDDTLNALLSLGYRENEALEAVRTISSNEIINLPQAIKLALRELSS